MARKALKFEKHEHRIGTWALTALINGDYSGQSQDDTKQIEKWCEQFKGYKSFDVCCPEEESHFGRDEISGLMGDVVDLIVMVQL